MSWIVVDLLGRALDAEAARLPLEVVLGRLEQVRGDLLRLVARIRRETIAVAAPDDRRRAARVGAEAVGRVVGVALLHLDVLRRDARAPRRRSARTSSRGPGPAT